MSRDCNTIKKVYDKMFVLSVLVASEPSEVNFDRLAGLVGGVLHVFHHLGGAERHVQTSGSHIGG